MPLAKATSQDIQTLLEIERTALGLKTYSGYFNEKEIRDWIENEIVFLIKNDCDVTVGSISYQIKNKTHAYISGLIIKPEFQKQGLAKKALSLLLEKLKNYPKLSLVVHPENPAIKLYLSFGFAIKSRKENYFGDGQPRLVMVKEKSAS